MKRQITIFTLVAFTLFSCGDSGKKQNQVNQDSVDYEWKSTPKKIHDPKADEVEKANHEQDSLDIAKLEKLKNQRVDTTVNWDKPLYCIDKETGDTVTKWDYRENDTAYFVDTRYCYEHAEGVETKTYDKNGRLLSVESYGDTGNSHNVSKSYSYDGKVMTSEGCEITSGCDFYTVYKEVTYFSDCDFKMDTLVQNFTEEVPWAEEESKNIKSQLSDVKRKFYENGKLVSEIFMEYNYSDTLEFCSKTVYDYNANGLVIRTSVLDKNGNPKYDGAVTFFSYKDNTCICENSSTTEITYYAKK